MAIIWKEITQDIQFGTEKIWKRLNKLGQKQPAAHWRDSIRANLKAAKPPSFMTKGCRLVCSVISLPLFQEQLSHAGTSFLKDCMNEDVFSKSITVTDDPKRTRGLRSMAFDAEGLDCEKLTPVSEGQLTCWLLDTSTGKQLDMPSNGRAARGIGSPPSPSASNLYIEDGNAFPSRTHAANWRGTLCHRTDWYGG